MNETRHAASSILFQCSAGKKRGIGSAKVLIVGKPVPDGGIPVIIRDAVGQLAASMLIVITKDDARALAELLLSGALDETEIELNPLMGSSTAAPNANQRKGR